MTSVSKLTIVVLTCLTLATSADAQSPREQLKQMTTQLQQSPNDTALREKIIKLGAKIKPLPAVPEEARRPFVEGVTILKSAKDVDSQQLAIGSFHEALKIAPWWGDAYYNLAVAQELTGQLDDAERTLKWFLLSSPSESDAREAQDRVYALAAKRKLAAAEAGAKQEQVGRAMVAQAQRFMGDWFTPVESWSGGKRVGIVSLILSISRDAVGTWRIRESYSNIGEIYAPTHDIQIVGTKLRWKVDDGYTGKHGFINTSTREVSATLSADGNTLRLAHNRMPFTARQEAARAGGAFQDYDLSEREYKRQ